MIKILKTWLDHFPYIKQPLRKIYKNIEIKMKPELTPVICGDFDLNELVQLLGKDDPVIVEIGCNNGSHTAVFLELFPKAKIYAFEPDPRACEKFIQRLGNHPRVKLEKVAISAVDGEIDFFMSDSTEGWDMSGSIRQPRKHLEFFPWIRFEKTVKVPTKKLDTWFREVDVRTIDFIWADVQGAEIDLIKGGQNALAQTRYFYTEYSNEELYEGQITLRDILKLLPNFKLVYRFGGDVLLKNKRLK